MPTLKRSASPKLLVLLAALALACTAKDDKKENAPATADKTGETKEKAAGDDGAKPTEQPTTDKPGGLVDTVRDAIPTTTPATGSANLPNRGSALGWFTARNPGGTLASIGTQVVPSQYKMYTDPETLRSLGSMLGGPPASLIKGFDVSQSVGCALIDDTAVTAPVACFFGYTGGAAAASTDLSEGKKPDAMGHVAHHVVEGQDLYLDDLGSFVVATTHAGLFDKSKDFLDKTLIPHAKAQRDDLSFVVFPAPTMKRYEADIAPLLGMLASTTPGGAATMDVYKEMDTFAYGFALEPDGVHLRMTVTATPGTGYAKLVTAFQAGDLEQSYIGSMPGSTWMIAGYRMHGRALAESDVMQTMLDSVITTYGGVAGKDAAAANTAVRAFIKEAETLYGSSVTVALVHEPGTTGAAVVQIEKTAPGREAWKTWSESFTPAAALGTEGAAKVSWTFRTDAVTTDGVAADRWVIVPKTGDPDIADLAKRFGGKAELTIDRYELTDRVVFVAALSDIDKSAAAALAAIKGTGTLADAPGAAPTLDASYKTAGLLAADLKRMFAWVATIAPEKAPYPAVGTDLGDAVVYTTISGTSYDIDMKLSQSTLDQIKALIP